MLYPINQDLEDVRLEDQKQQDLGKKHVGKLMGLSTLYANLLSHFIAHLKAPAVEETCSHQVNIVACLLAVV